MARKTTKTTPTSENVFVREKRPDVVDRQDVHVKFQILKNDENLDLTDHVYLQTQGGVEEWVHKDDYDYWKAMVDRNKAEQKNLKDQLKNTK